MAPTLRELRGFLLVAPLCVGAGLIVGATLGDAPADEAAPAPLGPAAPVAGVPSLAPLVDQVRGSVVGVRTRDRAAPPPADGAPEEAVDDADDAGDTGEPADPVVRPDGGSSQGTGVLIDRRGLVLTALHVVARADAVRVDVPAHGAFDADVVGADPSTDLAVLQLQDLDDGVRAELVVAPLGDSRAVRQGDWIFALGEPLAFRQTLTVGVVGYVGRHLRHDGGGVSNDYLQFSAQSLPGSSGSPVFDLHGQVVGVVTRATDGGPSFAITARVIDYVLRRMREHDGRVLRAHIGAGLARADRGIAVEYVPPGGTAVRVGRVASDRPAAAAGLQRGDVLVAVDGEPIPSIGALHERITWAEPGTRVRLDVVRDGRPVGPIEVEVGIIEPRQAADPVE